MRANSCRCDRRDGFTEQERGSEEDRLVTSLRRTGNALPAKLKAGQGSHDNKAMKSILCVIMVLDVKGDGHWMMLGTVAVWDGIRVTLHPLKTQIRRLTLPTEVILVSFYLGG